MTKPGQAFIKSLYSILNNKSLSSILHWQEDSLSFSIVSITEFESIILKIFFPEMNLKKFKRKLKLLDFSKCKLGSSLIYTHRYFQRLKPNLLSKICGTKEKASRKKNNLNEDLLIRITMMESLHGRMEEAAENLERKFRKIIDLNKFLISELEDTQGRNPARIFEIFQESKNSFKDLL